DGVACIELLRLIDAFGQHKKIDSSNTIYPSGSTTYPSDRGTSDWIKLYTRLNQPAKLSFRFLSASDAQQEMNSHPASSPICGWVMHNKLDYSLMFYDQNGNPIGALQPGATQSGEGIVWHGPPGPDYNKTLEACFAGKNAQLKALAKATQQNGLSYLKHLLDTIDKTAGYAAPQGYASSVGNAILVGRPLALVQTFLRLELQGLPAVNESWEAFEQDIKNTNDPLQRTTNAFTQVQFPVKLGDHTHFEDGVIGYFTTPDGKAIDYTTFHASTPNPTPHSHITTEDAIHLQPYSILDKTSPSQPTLGQNVSLLVDPRASLHAITGILPVKAIKIPEDQYVEALKSIYVTFLTAPVLSSMSQDKQISVPIGLEPGKKWSWIEMEQSEWVEKQLLTGPQRSIFKNPQQAYEGWLKLARQQQTDSKKE
ncbi:MAG: hypothetical protein AAFQ78_03440, partial [Bacteroidota bacterium]